MTLQKCICDICGIEEPKRHFKIKEQKLIFSAGCDCKVPRWKEIDLCDTCFENLAKLRYERSLEERIWNEAIGGNFWTEHYKDNPDMQSAYLEGVQHCLDILTPNRIKNRKLK